MISNQLSVFKSPSIVMKIADRKDQLSAANKSIINNFQVDLEEKIRSLSASLSSFIGRQKEQLDSMEEICGSCLKFQDEVMTSSLILLNQVFVYFFIFLSAGFGRICWKGCFFKGYVHLPDENNSEYRPVAHGGHGREF